MSEHLIPYGKQNITEEDISEVVETLRATFLTQGPKIPQFEEAFGAYINNSSCVAVSNGTAALHLAALALGLKPGEKVITTPITFAASANCVEYCGGEVLFADIDPETYLIDLNSVKEILAREKGVVGIIPVDFAGRVVDSEKLREIANQFNCWILEDACHAPGGYFIDSMGKKVMAGSCKYSDAAIFSFHPVKHIACGEGGMISFKNAKHKENATSLRTHGITRDTALFQNTLGDAVGKQISNASEYPGWYMEMQELGYNYRLTDIQAALGLSQLKRAEDGIIVRQKIAAKYFEAFKGVQHIKGQSGIVDGHAYHLYVIEVENRLEVYNHLRENGIFAQIHYIPVHKMPYYRQKNSLVELPNSEGYYAKCLSLPMYPTLKKEEQEYVIKKVLECCS